MLTLIRLNHKKAREEKIKKKLKLDNREQDISYEKYYKVRERRMINILKYMTIRLIANAARIRQP